MLLLLNPLKETTDLFWKGKGKVSQLSLLKSLAYVRKGREHLILEEPHRAALSILESTRYGVLTILVEIIFYNAYLSKSPTTDTNK